MSVSVMFSRSPVLCRGSDCPAIVVGGRLRCRYLGDRIQRRVVGWPSIGPRMYRRLFLECSVKQKII